MLCCQYLNGKQLLCVLIFFFQCCMSLVAHLHLCGSEPCNAYVSW